MYEIIFDVLKKLKKFCLIHKFKKLAIPRIAHDIDKLRWQTISNMINKLYFLGH